MNKVFKRYFSLFLTWAPFIVHKRPTTCLTVNVYWSSWCQNLWYLFCFVLHLYLLFCCCLFYYLYSMASSRIQWLLPVCNGFFSYSMASSRIQWLLPVFNGFFLYSMASSRIQWLLPVFNGFFPYSMSSSRIQWLLPVFNGFFPCSMASSRIQVFIIGLWLGLWCLIFNNISVISWRSVLLVEETGVPGENHRPAPSHWQTLSHKVVSSIPRLQRDSKSNL